MRTLKGKIQGILQRITEWTRPTTANHDSLLAQINTLEQEINSCRNYLIGQNQKHPIAIEKLESKVDKMIEKLENKVDRMLETLIDHVDYEKLADNIDAWELAKSLSYERLADEINLEHLARGIEVDPAEVADEMCCSQLASYITVDPDDLDYRKLATALLQTLNHKLKP